MQKSVWELAVTVMDMHEQSKLKGQKLRLSTLLSKPEFKQQYFAPIRAMEEKEQYKLLQRVINGELSIVDLKQAAVEVKQLESLKLAFLRSTNIDSWECAQDRLPLFANEDQLKKFSKINTGKAIPKSFIEFCSRAKQSEGQNPDSGIEIQLKDANGYVITSKLTELSSYSIKQVFGAFSGSKLTINFFTKVKIYKCIHIYIQIYLYTCTDKMCL